MNENAAEEGLGREPFPAERLLSEKAHSLKRRVERHVENLEKLVDTLEQLGMGAADIAQHVAEISEDYSFALRHAINHF